MKKRSKIALGISLGIIFCFIIFIIVYISINKDNFTKSLPTSSWKVSDCDVPVCDDYPRYQIPLAGNFWAARSYTNYGIMWNWSYDLSICPSMTAIKCWAGPISSCEPLSDVDARCYIEGAGDEQWPFIYMANNPNSKDGYMLQAQKDGIHYLKVDPDGCIDETKGDIGLVIPYYQGETLVTVGSPQDIRFQFKYDTFGWLEVVQYNSIQIGKLGWGGNKTHQALDACATIDSPVPKQGCCQDVDFTGDKVNTGTCLSFLEDGWYITQARASVNDDVAVFFTNVPEYCCMYRADVFNYQSEVLPPYCD
tara:strand:+ start:903 stop:1826 length:924 start_codon:yes stop_codon:yes gene_type:complete